MVGKDAGFTKRIELRVRSYQLAHGSAGIRLGQSEGDLADDLVTLISQACASPQNPTTAKPTISMQRMVRSCLQSEIYLSIGWGPDADRRAKLLICRAVEGSLLKLIHRHALSASSRVVRASILRDLVAPLI